MSSFCTSVLRKKMEPEERWASNLLHAPTVIVAVIYEFIDQREEIEVANDDIVDYKDNEWDLFEPWWWCHW